MFLSVFFIGHLGIHDFYITGENFSKGKTLTGKLAVTKNLKNPGWNRIQANNHVLPGLSLRAGDRGFPPATRSLSPGYFDINL